MKGIDEVLLARDEVLVEIVQGRIRHATCGFIYDDKVLRHFLEAKGFPAVAEKYECGVDRGAEGCTLGAGESDDGNAEDIGEELAGDLATRASASDLDFARIEDEFAHATKTITEAE